MTKQYATKLKEKLAYLADKLERLKQFQSMGMEEFNADDRNEATVERYFQTAIEAAIDIAQLITIDKQLEKPGEIRTQFSILADADILPKELAEKLNMAKRFRNVLVHEYVSIEREYIHQALKYDIRDLEHYVGVVARYLRAGT